MDKLCRPFNDCLHAADAAATSIYATTVYFTKVGESKFFYTQTLFHAQTFNFL